MAFSEYQIFKNPILGEIPKAFLIRFNERLLEPLENTLLPEKKVMTRLCWFVEYGAPERVLNDLVSIWYLSEPFGSTLVLIYSTNLLKP